MSTTQEKSERVTGEVRRCEHCGSVISEREIAIYKGMVHSLWKVFKWCNEKEIHEFEMKDIRGLLGQVNYTRFGDWVMFGGLVYKHKKAHYGLNIDRCSEFFEGKRKIPFRVWKNPVTKEIRKEEADYRSFNEMPGVTELLNTDGEYIARYRHNVVEI